MKQQYVQLVCSGLAAVCLILAIRPGEATSFDGVPACNDTQPEHGKKCWSARYLLRAHPKKH
jgi:hypothetical protein